MALDGVHLEPGPDRRAEIDALADSLGGRVGLEAVLADRGRRARRVPVPGRAVTWGYALGPRELLTRRWWPQGVTTSADAGPTETFAGRSVVLTSSYSTSVRGASQGSRLTVFDVSDARRVRYSHVLLVEASLTGGRPTFAPVRVHAGGIVWRRGHVHVAATARGLVTFRLDDLVRLPAGSVEGFGHRYALPLRFAYTAVTAPGAVGLRYSFVSLGREDDRHQLLAGEYGRGARTTRLVSYDLDAASGLLHTDARGRCRPSALDVPGIEGMQGAVPVAGRLYVSQSHGRWRRGSLWVAQPDGPREWRDALPPGPEDLSYWPSRDQLWTVTEHPPMRFLCALDRPSGPG
jgi:hypothetical protein